MMMRTARVMAAAGLAVLSGTTAMLAQATLKPAAQVHIEAARKAAGTDNKGVFDVTCGYVTQGPRPSTPAAPRQPGPPARETWYKEPAKVFDNLYFLGQSEYSSWAVTTSQGIIVIDTIYDYSIEDEVVNGLKAVGLGPTTIKYAVVSHAHVDHIGGAKYLQEHFGTRVVMSSIDWDVASRVIETYLGLAKKAA